MVISRLRSSRPLTGHPGQSEGYSGLDVQEVFGELAPGDLDSWVYQGRYRVVAFLLKKNATRENPHKI